MLKIYKIDWIYLLVLFFCVPIPFLQTITVLKNIYYFTQFLMLMFTIIHVIRNKKISIFLILLLGYYVLYMFSTLLNYSENINIIVRYIIQAVPLLYFTDYCLKKNQLSFFSTGVLWFSIMLIINVVTIVLYPKGLYIGSNTNPHYFLGMRNDIVEYAIPAITFGIVFSCITKINEKYSLFTCIIYVCSTITVLLTWSVNAILSIFIIILITFLPTRFLMDKFISFWQMGIIYFGMFFGFVVFRIQYLFEWFIVGVLHKSLTMTTRTYIWDKAIEYIKRKPIFGYGFEQALVKKSKIGHPNSCHNYVLDLFYSGGILLFGYMLFIVIIIGRKLKFKDSLSIKLLGVMFGYMVIWFATPIHIPTIQLMFVVFIVIYNNGLIYRRVKDEKKC